MFQVFFTPAARAEVIEAWSWYEAVLPEPGDRFREEIDDAVKHITANPKIYAAVFQGVRRILLKKFPYG